VVKIGLRGVHTREAHGAGELIAAAGEPWTNLRAHERRARLAGFEA